jgi:hypothetical protein
MKRFSTSFGVLGLSFLLLLLSLTPAEACRRGRHRYRCAAPCQPVTCGMSYASCCGPSLGTPGAVVQPYTSYICMYCDGTTWQQAKPGQTCVMLPAGNLGHSCSSEKEPRQKGVPAAGRVLKGCNVVRHANGSYSWNSDLHSRSYCDGYFFWWSPNVVRTTFKGYCDNGAAYYDIEVSD